MNTQYVALIILNYNNWEDTINCIESVERYNTAAIKYIVVDNGSTREGAPQALDRYLKERFTEQYCKVEEREVGATRLNRITFLASKVNDGYARGNNKGLKLAYGDDEINKVMILNNDVLFVEDIIPRLVQLQQEITGCAIISPILYKKDLEAIDYNCARRNHTDWEIINTYLLWYRDLFGYISRTTRKRLMLKENPDLMRLPFFEIELPSGSCMLIDKALLREIGGFDPNTFLYFEENILYKKIQNAGKKNYLVPTLKCIHLGASSTSKSSHPHMVKSGMNSAAYYLRTYCQLNMAQRAMLSFAIYLFSAKVHAMKMIARKVH